MSRFYVPALALAVLATSASAQQHVRSDRHSAALKTTYSAIHPTSHPVQYGADRDVIWSDDFSNASNWTIGNINDPNNDNWVIGTTAPSGAFAIPAILSTTAANGFGLFDSDLLCGGAQNAYLQMVNPVDLSAHSGVVLQFEQYFRDYQGFCYIDYSTDGSNWTPIEINDLDVNASTDNPELFSLNLSSQLGGQATAWIRFRYEGGCDYAWMVDDAAIIDLPEYEIVMDYGFTSHTGTGEEYGRIPLSQLNPTMNVGAEIANFGSSDQTNVVVNMSVVNDGGTEVFTATQNLGTMVQGDTLSMDQTVTLPTLTAGVYTATFTVTSDQIGSDNNPDDNTRVRTFELTDDLYSLDGIGIHPAGTEHYTQAGTGSFADNPSIRLMNYYPIRTDMVATGVQIILGSETAAGSFLSVSIHDTTDVLAAFVDAPLVESDLYTITAADVDAGEVTVPFSSPYTLEPNGYYVSANINQDNANDLYIVDDATTPQPGLASILYTPVDDQNQFIYGGNGTAWAIRLTSSNSIGISENHPIAGLSLFPNPTGDIVHLTTTTAENYNIEIMNAMGAMVRTTRFAGNTTLDMSGEARGIYTVRVSNANASSVLRLTVN